MFLLMVIFTAACGENESSANENDAVNDSGQVEQTGDDQSAPEKEEVSVEIEDQFFKRFTDGGTGMESVGVYAELKNTGDVPADVPYVEATLYDKDDNVLSVSDAQQTLAEGSLLSPTTIEPDSSSYIALKMDYEEKFDDLDHIDIDYEADPAYEDGYESLDVDKVNVMGEADKYDDMGKERDDFDENPISDMDITLILKNTYDEDLNHEVGIGLYDKDDELIGTMIDLDYVDVDYSIEANSDKNVEVTGSLPVDIDKVDHAEVEAIGVENTEDY